MLDVVPGERIVWSTTMKDGYRPNEFADDGCNGFPFTAVHTFEDAGDGKTRYTATVMHANAKDRDAHAAMGFDERLGDLRRADGRSRARARRARITKSAGARTSPALPFH